MERLKAVGFEPIAGIFGDSWVIYDAEMADKLGGNLKLLPDLNNGR
jgi:hypothetical protein